MNYAFEMVPNNTKNSLVMEFLQIHKWTALMLGGGLLSIPVLPPETGYFGVLLVAIGAWRQFVEVQHTRADAKRKQELHEAQAKREEELHREKLYLMQKLHEGKLDATDLAVLRDLLGG
jgi:hypothetical protein